MHRSIMSTLLLNCSETLSQTARPAGKTRSSPCGIWYQWPCQMVSLILPLTQGMSLISLYNIDQFHRIHALSSHHPRGHQTLELTSLASTNLTPTVKYSSSTTDFLDSIAIPQQWRTYVNPQLGVFAERQLMLASTYISIAVRILSRFRY